MSEHHSITIANNSKGFGTFAIFVILSAFIFMLLPNMDVLTNQTKSANSLNDRVDANILAQNLTRIVSDAAVAQALLSTTQLSDGTLVNHSATTNKGIRCVLDKKVGGGTIACPHKEIPTVFTSPCLEFPTAIGKKICWITRNLADHKVDVIFPGRPGPFAPNDLIIDNRLVGGGLTSQFLTCPTFGQTTVGNDCAYRAEIYLWVECAGSPAPTTCGGTTGVGGVIKVAAILTIPAATRNFATQKYSTVDFQFGLL